MSTSLLIAVVADELEERAAAIAREEGAMGLTIVPGRGLGFPEHVTFFGLTFRGIEKVLLWVLDSETAETVANRLNRELDLLSPFQGWPSVSISTTPKASTRKRSVIMCCPAELGGVSRRATRIERPEGILPHPPALVS
ncbi:MAG TPA: hypothetical protein PLN31_00655 [Azoarcus taiwanensis]|nr:hypothetical protein [Azoarcus taiwanensis]